MTDAHFGCTRCGKCCYGWVPLTLADALAHADRFPLALLWTPVRAGAKAFALTARIGITVPLAARKQLAVRITPALYLPPSMPCPALTAEGLCGIHDTKPLRCRTMPFFPYREESDQFDLLIPRKGWECDVSEAAPVVYRDHRILERAGFDAERAALLDEAAMLGRAATWLLTALPSLKAALHKVAARAQGGHVVVDFAALLPRLGAVDVEDFARRQRPVLLDYAARTAGLPALAEYHAHYRDWAEAMG